MKTSIVAVLIAIGLLGGYVGGRVHAAMIIQSAMASAFKGFPEPVQTEAKPITATLKPLAVYNEAGKDYDLRMIKLTILGVAEKDTLTSKYGRPVVAKEGTKFVVVEVKVTSKLEQTATIFPDNVWRLVDGQGRKYMQSGDYWQSVDDYLGARDLGPGIPEKGKIVYEVPKDASGFYLQDFKY